MKREDGVLLSSMRGMKGVWKGHCEDLMHEETPVKAIMSSMGMETGGQWVFVQRETEKKMR